jgi:predicted dehydrogenase
MIERILIVGLGSIGQRHLCIVRAEHPHADVRVLRRSAEAAVPEGAQGVLARLDDALAFAPQLAVIASPASQHLAVATALVAGGCHVLIEKPLCLADDNVTPLLDTLRKRPGTVAQVGYNLRFVESLRYFRECVHQRRVGRVLSVRCEAGQHLPDWRPGRDYRESASAQRAFGGGVMMELSHELDYLKWIFGPCFWVNAYLGRHSSLEVDVEDTALLWLGHRGEVDAEQVVTALAMDFYRRDSTRRCTVIGERGTLLWDAIRSTVEVIEPGASEAEVLCQSTAQRDDSYLSQWRSFVAATQGRPVIGASVQDGLDVLALIRAARQSHQFQSAQVAPSLACES